MVSKNFEKILKKASEASKNIDKRIDKVSSKIGKKMDKALTKKVKVRKVLRGKKMVVRIPEHKPAEYVPLYFKSEVEDAKKSMFLS